MVATKWGWKWNIGSWFSLVLGEESLTWEVVGNDIGANEPTRVTRHHSRLVH